MIEKEKAQMRLDVMMNELNRLEKVEKQKKDKDMTKIAQPKLKQNIPVVEKNSAKTHAERDEDESSSENDSDFEDDGAEARGYRVIFNNKIAAPTELKEEVN
jgi:hypothetical protein